MEKYEDTVVRQSGERSEPIDAGRTELIDQEEALRGERARTVGVVGTRISAFGPDEYGNF